jgi:transposase InsO family protein
VDGEVKRALLGLIEQAVEGGWTFGRTCRLLGLGERRARDWQARAAAGTLTDRRPGAALHGLRPQEVQAILALAREWGEVDGSHRKLAHRGSYLSRVGVSPSSVLRVLLEHGQRLPYRPPRERSVKRPWPDWADYKPLQVWGYDFSAFTAAQTSALAILDLVSRKWIETMLCPEATDVQVQALFTRALDAEGLLQQILDLADHHHDHGDDDEDDGRCPVLLIVSDNGAQMTSGNTREFMALHALACHYGRPGTPTDQAHIESLWGHVKHDWPHLETLSDPADLARELDAARHEYNTIRLHAAIGYVTPDDEHEGRGPRIRAARRAGLEQARLDRLAYHRQQRLELSP